MRREAGCCGTCASIPAPSFHNWGLQQRRAWVGEPDGYRKQGWAMLYLPFGVQQEVESPPMCHPDTTTTTPSSAHPKACSYAGNRHSWAKNQKDLRCQTAARGTGETFPGRRDQKQQGSQCAGLVQAAAPHCSPPCPPLAYGRTSPMQSPGHITCPGPRLGCPGPPGAQSSLLPITSRSPWESVGDPPTPARPSPLWPG